MADIRRILCPIDFSDISRHALEHAFAFARWHQARVSVLHVWHVSLPVSPTIGIPTDVSGIAPLRPDDLVADVRRFSGVVDGAHPEADVVVDEGSPVRMILRRAEQLPADLLVMGTHGRSGFEALFLGSTTEKVLRSTHVPVLTVPPAVEHVETVLYKTILCPVEFSDPSTRALEYALPLAEETGARLILLHVIEQLSEPPQPGQLTLTNLEEYRRAREEDARARLQSAVPDGARVWCTPDVRVLSGKAYRVILEVAEREKAEVIVMGVHGKGALNRRLFGSTTHHVIRQARCPVLTLRA